jgi:lipopolysaccharide transport system ATP-binding protein
MSELAIRVENLGKRYRIGTAPEKYATLRDSLAGAVRKPFKMLRAAYSSQADGDDHVWALRGVSFEVKRGEVVGVIGLNGAGKSTLLKILSRITDPTEGIADIHGRVGSLLEVGTGFHPELTGRENIYLNGAILGMTRAEIDKKLDAIIEFSGVEKFIETPVKRYSSGMYLRLAFSVAAHLDPEILLVDEVLAVGDATFQAKCLGKMEEVAKEGRTVLFTSHNLAAINSLCSTGLLLKHGALAASGPVQHVVGQYLAKDTPEESDLRRHTDRRGDGPLQFRKVRIFDGLHHAAEFVQAGDSIRIDVAYECTQDWSPNLPLVFHVAFSALTGERLFVCSTRLFDGAELAVPVSGAIRCSIPCLPLMPGRYRIDLVCKIENKVLDHVRNARTLTVVEGDFFGNGKLPSLRDGPFLVDHKWEVLTRSPEQVLT